MTNLLNHNDERQTDTDESAIATLAIHGCKTTPNGKNTPAAIGTSIMLYKNAYIKFIRMRRIAPLQPQRPSNCSKQNIQHSIQEKQ